MKIAFCIGTCDSDELIDSLIRELEEMKGHAPFLYSFGPNTLENRTSMVDALMKYDNQKQVPTEVT